MEEMRGFKAEKTLSNEKRSLKLIHRDLQKLKDQGKIKTVNPMKIDEQVIKEYIIFLRAQDIDNNTRVKYLQYLDSLLISCDNATIKKMKMKYKKQFPKSNHRKPIKVLTTEEMKTMIESTQEVPGWEGDVLRIIIPMYYMTGLRVGELRQSWISDLNDVKWTLFVRFPKGDGTWGVQRTIEIPQILRPTIKEYLIKRKEKLSELKIDGNKYLIPNLSNRNVTGKPYTCNTFRRMKREHIEEKTGIKFELRQLRRTYGQHLKDQGVSIEKISKILGHSSTKTTETYYARVQDSDAFESINEAWNSSPIAQLLNPSIEFEPDVKN